MGIHNPQGVDDPKAIATEIKRMFGRESCMVSKNELMASILKMRSMVGYLHVELYCANPKHRYFKQVFDTLGAVGTNEMERVRLLRMTPLKRWLCQFLK